MEMKNSFMVCTGTAVAVVLLLLCSCSCAPTLAPAPAPAAPTYVNLTDLLSVAGPFRTFLNYLDTTKVIDTFQNRANNTKEGITIFVPKDESFNNNNKNKKQLSNLTNDQLKSFCLFHALNRYYTLSDFTILSRQNPVPTLAGATPVYSLNLTDNSGTIFISSGWTRTKVSSAVHAADPVAIYQVDSVLLPEAIFGTDIPPTLAPAPDIAADADTNHTRGGAGGSASSDSSSPTSTPSSSSHRVSNLGHLIASAAIVGGGGLLLMFWF